MDTWSTIVWEWRQRWRLSQQEAARWVNVSETTWRRWEQGRGEPRVEEARRVLTWLVRWEADQHREEVAAEVRARLDYERELRAEA